VIHYKALFTRDILAHFIAIKRYCDKKIILSHRFLLAKVSSFLSLPWLGVETYGSKNIFIAILYAKMSLVKKAPKLLFGTKINDNS